MPLDQLIENFYSKLGLDFKANLKPGQICRAIVLYSDENAEIWRPSHYDASQTQAMDFSSVPKPGNAYKEAKVIQSPRLDAYEEFPVIRGKQRPVVILAPDLPLIGVKPDRMKLDKHLCLIAPSYSVVDPMGKSKLDSNVLDRIRTLEFPHFLFLPKTAVLANDSLLRLDSLTNTYRAHLEPTQWSLAPDVWEIVYGQLDFIFSGVFGGSFKAARDILQGK